MAFRRFRSRRPVSRRIKSVFGRGTPSIFRGGQVRYVWNGRKIITELNESVLRAFARAEADAKEYWDNVVWAPDLHPYATGDEQRSARFRVGRGKGGRVEFIISVPVGDDNHALYHEFGTKDYEGHFPVRQTIDFIAPRIRSYLAEELGRAKGAT